MFKKLILASTISATILLTGCKSTGDDQSAATLDRYQAINSLSLQIEEVGFKQGESLEDIPDGVEQFVNMADSLVRRQYDVMGAFRTQAENYADVSAFLYAYADATPAQLAQAIEKFDAGAQSQEEKIGPKIAVYNASLDAVADSNLQLGLELAEQAAIAAMLLRDYAPQIAQASALSFGTRFMRSEEERTADNDMVLALKRASDQIKLAYDANRLIKLEKDTITAINDLQADLESQS